MDEFCNDTIYKLETAINELELETDCSIQRIEIAIQLIVECLADVREYVMKRCFKNTDEEIRFFKYQKPAIVAKLIYYNAIYKIKTKKPNWQKPNRNYLNKELKQLKRFFDNILYYY